MLDGDTGAKLPLLADKELLLRLANVDLPEVLHFGMPLYVWEWSN